MRTLLKCMSAISVFFLIGCGQDKNTDSEIKRLSTSEQSLCDSIKFRKQLVDIIKLHTDHSITLIPKINEFGEVTDSTGHGLCSKCDMEKAKLFILAYKEKFRQESYLIFIFTNDKTGLDYVGIIRGRDELDILKWRKTNGINYGYENGALVNKFKEWKRKEDFYIVAAGKNYVDIKFTGPIRNAEKFAGEAYAFCPGVLENGTNDMFTLVQEIKTTNGLNFWWN